MGTPAGIAYAEDQRGLSEWEPEVGVANKWCGLDDRVATRNDLHDLGDRRYSRMVERHVDRLLDPGRRRFGIQRQIEHWRMVTQPVVTGGDAIDGSPDFSHDLVCREVGVEQERSSCLTRVRDGGDRGSRLKSVDVDEHATR